MKALLVIHGYPRRYNAGSEVYTQNLAHALYDAGWEIEVFAREEDPFLPDYHMRTEQDHLYPNIPVHLVNHARSNIRFQNISIDHVFQNMLIPFFGLMTEIIVINRLKSFLESLLKK